MNYKDTGLTYKDGSPIKAGDNIELLHDTEVGENRFVRKVAWSNDYAAFVAACPATGWVRYLADTLQDPNVKSFKKL